MVGECVDYECVSRGVREGVREEEEPNGERWRGRGFRTGSLSNDDCWMRTTACESGVTGGRVECE